MEHHTRIGRVEEFTDRRPREVAVDGVKMVVVKADGGFFAFENNCPHQHFSVLHLGSIDDCTITCPMHGWSFDLRSGAATNGNGRLRMAVVKVENGTLWVKAGESGQSYALFEEERTT